MQIENEKSRSKYDLTGHEFGLLTVVGMAPRERDEKGHLLPVKWICKCECGGEIVAKTGNLIAGNVKSCGCLLKSYFPLKGRPKKERSGTCPFPSKRCCKNKAGKCCMDCEERKGCVEACQNSPERCGRDK